MSEWIGYARRDAHYDLARAVTSLDPGATLRVTGSADELRESAATAPGGQVGVVVGPVSEGVCDVNLAAAIAHDGNARGVVLARHGVSGSLRSRSACAGIDLVLDLDEIDGLEAPRPAPPTAGVGAAGGREVGGPAVADGPALAGVAAGRPAVDGAVGGHEAGAAGPCESRRAKVLTLCSGRGGTGKTSLAATMAAHACAWGMDVVLLDLDLSCGNLYSCFGLASGADLLALADGSASPSATCAEALPGCRLLGPCARPEEAELAMPHVGELLSWAACVADLVVVDTSTTFTDAVAQAAQMADRLLLVGDARSSVSSLARASGLAVRLGVARTRIARVENRASTRSRMDFSLGRAEVGLEAARGFRVFDAGDEVAAYLDAGLAADLAAAGGPFSESVAVVLAQVLGELGCLPDCEGARRAAQGDTSRRWSGLLGLRRGVR